MGRKLLYIFLVLMLLINAALLYMIIDKRMSKGPSKGQTFLTEQLNFSEAQKNQFFDLDEIHRQKMRKMDRELKSLREQLFNSFGDDESSIDSITTKLGAIETQKNRELFTFFSQVRELCNKDQAKKFDQIIQEVLRKRGPRHPKGNRGGPPEHPR